LGFGKLAGRGEKGGKERERAEGTCNLTLLAPVPANWGKRGKGRPKKPVTYSAPNREKRKEKGKAPKKKNGMAFPTSKSCTKGKDWKGGGRGIFLLLRANQGKGRKGGRGEEKGGNADDSF